jgi:hypothetical protein
MTHRPKSLTATGTSGYKQSSRNLPNSLTLAVEFIPWNR